MKWPSYYPADCPPTEAKPASGTVYRLVRHDPPQAEDFKTPWEEYPGRFAEPTIENCGLSVHTDLQDSERLKERVPQFRKRQIAEGMLNPKLGMIQHTPLPEDESHHDWWVPIGTESWLVFNVMN